VTVKVRRWKVKLLLKRVAVIVALILELAVFAGLILYKSSVSKTFAFALRTLSLFMALWIISRDMKAEFKLSWVFMILVFPVFGGVTYLLFVQLPGRKRNTEVLRKETFSGETMPERYLSSFAETRICDNCLVEYLSSGKAKLERLIAELEKAGRYIFLEYFIIESGEMWDAVFEVLARKAAGGVEVRLIYDDVGCFMALPDGYSEKLSECGIKAAVFNSFKPLFKTSVHNRDHRKIVVIDGECAFTGGINLADSYIDKGRKFRSWKDASVLVKGEAAWSLGKMFLKIWDGITGEQTGYCNYLPERTAYGSHRAVAYGDSPFDGENVCENLYLNMINSATESLYISTPYLVIDEVMISSICLAAKNGVDVRIMIPEKGDHWFVHVFTRACCEELIASGVKIYEYIPGFIHSKVIVADGSQATVGTANLDYRSFNFHYECGLLFSRSDAVEACQNDFLDSIACCREMNIHRCRKRWFSRFLSAVLRVFSPLM